MPRTRRMLLLVVFTAIVLLSISSLSASAQSADEWFGDDHVEVYIAIDGRSITATSQEDPIDINLDGMTNLTLQFEVIGTQSIYNVTGAIGFYYQGIQVTEIGIQQETVQEIPPGAPIQPVEAQVNLGEMLEANAAGYDIDLAKGQFEASVNIRYWLSGEDVNTDPGHVVSQNFFILIPSDGLVDTITSVAGIATSVATVGSVYGIGMNFKSILDGLQTAHKVRSIQKKVGEIRSLPDLTVLGALPVLFSIVAGMRLKSQKRKKEKDKELAEIAESEGVSEYIVRQRLRETAPEAWPMDKCPSCFKKWKKEETTCQKCGIGIEEAKHAYADHLGTKVERALKVFNKKKSLSIRKLAKKIKTNEYNAGVIGAAMVDTDMTEITKIETPFRSFLLNIAGLALIILTWQQLLGGAASQFQTTLTIIGGALSLGVIVALYFARKMQIEKLTTELDAGGQMMPTEAERLAKESHEDEEVTQEDIDMLEEDQEESEEVEYLEVDENEGLDEDDPDE